MPVTVDYEIPLSFYYLKLDGYSPVFRIGYHVLIERFTGKTFVYKAVNLKSREITNLFYMKVKLSKEKHKAAADKIISIRDTEPGTEKTQAALKRGLELLIEKVNVIFSNVLIKYGYTVRKKQIELAVQMLTALRDNKIFLSEAAVGIGKTHAYLIAAVLYKAEGNNDFWIRCAYPDTNDFRPDTPMPVVISTSSIALQQAITQDYIPEISRILMENELIKQPLSSVVRKGKEHYICDVRLNDYYPHANEEIKTHLSGLQNADAELDLSRADYLTDFIKKKVCVTDNCNPDCPRHKDCRYLKMFKKVQSGRFDFQVCNHQYLLADLIRREQGAKPLIPNYNAVVIDEAHKLEQAAQSMYGTEISNREITSIARHISTLKFADRKLTHSLISYADRLMALNNQFFIALCAMLPAPNIVDDDTERFQASFTDSTKSAIRSLLYNLASLLERLTEAEVKRSGVAENQKNLFAYILYALKRLSERLKIFQAPEKIVCWLEIPKLTRKVTGEVSLCSIPKHLGKFLNRDLWSKRFPVLLTSGTLAAGSKPEISKAGKKNLLPEPFQHIRKRIGLDSANRDRITETVKPSPFDYQKNCLLYISEAVPFPDNQSRTYIKAVAGEVEKLIAASNGHAAVLFTSYRVMEMVFQIIAERDLGYPLFKLNRSGGGAIKQFRDSGNGVLFASGSLWEGIDLPGDILSLLVIVKLPFQVPDPLSVYEQSQYSNEAAYKRIVVVPDMLLKLKQGFGRLIRREDDTGVVAILDFRVRSGGAYREAALQALPKCRVTDSISDVEAFFRSIKSEDYFLIGG